MAMNKTLKVHSDTRSDLDSLKPEYEERFPEKYVSYDMIIEELIYEHFAHTNPKIIEEKKKKLLQDYIPKDNFNTVFDKKVELENKVIKLSEKHENDTKELEKLKENFNLEKQNYQNDISDLNKELTTKKQELSLSNQKNNELTEKTMNQEVSLKELQDKFDNCNSDYNSLKDFVDQECITIKSLNTMYHIARFLSHPLHKRSMYTIHQLRDKIHMFIYEDIQEALTLTNYKIFPVRHGQQDGIDFFYFDKKYLRY